MAPASDAALNALMGGSGDSEKESSDDEMKPSKMDASSRGASRLLPAAAAVDRGSEPLQLMSRPATGERSRGIAAKL